MPVLRRLNAAGLARFEEYIAILRGGGMAPPPSDALTSQVYSEQLGVEIAMPGVNRASENGVGNADMVAYTFNAVTVNLDVARHSGLNCNGGGDLRRQPIQRRLLR